MPIHRAHNVPPRDMTLAGKRAMIRRLIEQTTAAQRLSPADEAAEFETAPARLPQTKVNPAPTFTPRSLGEVIPFPTSGQ